MPVGRIWIAADDTGVTDVSYAGPPAGAVEGRTPLIDEAAEQLNGYFRGERREFDLPLSPSGTPFRLKVWEELRRIPYGLTVTYGQVAAAVGDPKASRAVGMANNRNPLAIIVPCHRVVGADGSLTGYAGGLANKELLLALEKKNK